MKPELCAHPHEAQSVYVSHKLHEIAHECQVCGQVEIQTLGIVETKQPNDLWKLVGGN